MALKFIATARRLVADVHTIADQLREIADQLRGIRILYASTVPEDPWSMVCTGERRGRPQEERISDEQS